MARCCSHHHHVHRAALYGMLLILVMMLSLSWIVGWSVSTVGTLRSYSTENRSSSTRSTDVHNKTKRLGGGGGGLTAHQKKQTNTTETETTAATMTPTISTQNFPRIVVWTTPLSLLSPSNYTSQQQNSSKSSSKRSRNNNVPHAREYELPKRIREVGIPGHYRQSEEGKCKIVMDWQKQIYPTCNNVHEVDFFGGMQKFRKDETEAAQYTTQTNHLGAGGTRDTWKVDVHELSVNTTTTTTLAFKTLRLLRDYIWTRIDHQRIDAIVSEHLTASPFIIDIYGYCGAAAINEFGTYGTLDKYITKAATATPSSSTKKKKSTTTATTITPLQRLEYARDIAYGMADIHEVDGDQTPTTTVIQHDVKLVNALVTADKKAKISDFNNAYFLKMNGDKHCYFHVKQTCTRLRIEVRTTTCRESLSCCLLRCPLVSFLLLRL